MWCAMENSKEIFGINENIEGYSLNRIIASEKVEASKVYFGASDSYFEDM